MKTQRLSICLTLLFLLAAAPGCINHPQHPAATQPSTNIDTKLATSQYWLAQPVITEVTYKELTPLWDACEATAREYFFIVDRRDYRAGLLTTLPLTSKQYMEFWRKDSLTNDDLDENTVQGTRRTIYFNFVQNPDGGYTVALRVVVERESKIDPKYRDPDLDVPNHYWYAMRRDDNLEVALSTTVRHRLAKLGG